VAIFLFLSLLCGLIVCENVLQPFSINPDTAIISNVLHNVADVFLTKQKIKFNILVLGYVQDFSWSILSEFLSRSESKFKYQIKFFESIESQNHLEHSNFIFLSSSVDFYYLENMFKPRRYQNEQIKYFVFIPNITLDQLKALKLYLSYDTIDYFTNVILFHTYFITNEAETVTLSSVEWYSPGECNRPSFKKLNTFSKKSLSWTSMLTNYDKFMQYHGCELVLMLPIPIESNNVGHVSGYCLPNEFNTDYEIHGIAPVIFEIASKFHNYSLGYQPVHIQPEWIFNPSIYSFNLYIINNTYKIPMVFFQVLTLHIYKPDLRVSNVIVNLNVNMLVTPGEKYTPYEKFLLPFDLSTWIFLGSTFFITFLIIFIINCLSKSTQNLVYGQRVETPLWNVVSIFFGISQTKLPNTIFSRFIFLLFIYFCLIFRTCFQSKFFELMTSEPRRSPPRTVEDVIDRKYNVYALIINAKLSGGEHRSEKW